MALISNFAGFSDGNRDFSDSCGKKRLQLCFDGVDVHHGGEESPPTGDGGEQPTASRP